ncbi:MAG TPA: class I SAM-dependent methyltransferase [Firmicutes bacterium]|jgi:ubiquinone/menaquinone biosynthesis C-methylase UbiE|nr:class I SAM-dependent methyltransferase [Bacillota bacterium]
MLAQPVTISTAELLEEWEPVSHRADNLFNAIAPFYGLFFSFQVRYYQKILERVKPLYDLSRYKSIIDVGCGTGALCYVLHSQGIKVTGVDSAERMLVVAANKLAHTDVQLVQASAHLPTPFPDKSFDIAISSYTAHGMKETERIKMYREMSRLAKHKVIFHDYNDNRTLIIDIVERLEGGHYFNFIKNAKEEMSAIFKDVTVLNIGLSAAWYVCTPWK